MTNKFNFGDWRLLHLLAYNMTPLVLGEFIMELETQMGEKRRQELPQNDSNSNIRKPLLTPI